MKERLKPVIGMKSETEKKATHLLTKNEKTIATAESCTGGFLAHRLTNVPGSTSYFEQGLVTYTSKAKIELLKVDEKVIEKKGAVSKETAKQMAEGARKKANSDLGLSTTEILGPGRDEGESIGTVYVGLSHSEGTEVKACHFSGNRREVKEQATEKALLWLIDFLKD